MAPSSRQFKSALYEQFALVGKALANPHRLELLDLLCQGPRTVEVLAQETAMSLPSTSQHLQVLRAGGLVKSQKDGLYVTYRLADEQVSSLFVGFRSIAETQLAEVARVTRDYFQSRGALEPISRTELLERARAGEVLVLDVRPAEEYAAGHLPAALSIPIQELEQRLAELPRTKTIVAYCRGPYCVYAVEAVKILTQQGFSAVRLEDGVPDWRAQGLAVEM